jgi:hypothetical protein
LLRPGNSIAPPLKYERKQKMNKKKERKKRKKERNYY